MSWVSQHDNAPTHSALSVREMSASKNIPSVPHANRIHPTWIPVTFFDTKNDVQKGQRFEDVNETFRNATKELKLV